MYGKDPQVTLEPCRGKPVGKGKELSKNTCQMI